jgi:signal transduction histidine kinase
MPVDAAAASESTPTGVRAPVADDDVVICRQMAANRSSAGYQVVTAHDGARALDLAIVEPMVAPTRVHQVLESVLEVSAPSLGRGVTISIDCKTNLMARFDPALVERVLHNLVGNAARYCNQGGSIVGGARRCNDDSVELSVTNSGPRTASDIRSQLFVKYVRGMRGMGLYFCWLVAEAHGKDRSCRSRSAPLRRAPAWARLTQFPCATRAGRTFRSTARPRRGGWGKVVPR